MYKYNIKNENTDLKLEESFLGIDGYYHYLYKITNNINNKFYIGIHSTKNLNDGYPGSGVRLYKAYAKYGQHNFSKEILRYFENRETMMDEEFTMITPELLLSDQCYNLSSGGGKTLFNHTIVRDTSGNVFKVDVNDPRLKSGELTGVVKNTIAIKLPSGDFARIPSYIYHQNPNIYQTTTKGKIIVHDNNMNTFMVDVNDPKLKDGTYTYLLKTINKDTALVKDSNDNLYRVHISDERFKNRELVGITKGTIKVVKDGVIKCIKESMLEEYINNGWVRGNLSSGKSKVYKDGKYKFIDKSELDEYLSNGWVKKSGSSGKSKVYKDGKYKFIDKSELDEYLSNGWSTDIPKRICVMKDGINKRILFNELDEYLSNGWVRGHGQKNCAGKIGIHKGYERKFIEKENLNEYLSNGWNIGLNHK